jgi:Neutral/alkaline non-lysosomal ceramidase, N-terminal
MDTRKFGIVFLFTLCLTGASLADAAEGGLRVGAAKVDFTPSRPTQQLNKYDHERLYVRAIVLDNGSARAALISLEGSQNEWAATSKLVAEELNCPIENIIMSSTHTHSGATSGGMPAPNAPPSQAVLEAVRQAQAKLQPARVGFGTGMCYLNVNRDAIDPEARKWVQYSNLDAPSDKTVSVLTFFKPTGEPIAVYVNYAMHPINGYVLGFFSGDFPGAMSRYVERAFGDNIIVAFTQGTSGDQNPLYLRPSNNAMASRIGNKITGFEINREASEGPLRMLSPSESETRKIDPKVLDNLFRFMESEGQILGEEVIRVMTWTKNSASNVQIKGLQKVVSCPGRKRTNGDSFDPKTREGIAGVYVDAPPVDIQIGVLGIGTVALASINGEVYSLIGQKVKDAAPMKDTVFVTSANGRGPGYIPDDGSYGHQTFQVLNTALKPGCAENTIVDTIRDLEAQYINK